MEKKIMKFNSTLAAFGIVLASVSAQASPITIFSTGVDNSGNVLANGTVGDPHYALISSPDGSTAIKVASSASGYPLNVWIGDNTTSRWIGPNTSTLAGPVGNYDYRTTFDLTGFDSTSAILSFIWATDDSGQNVLINGHATGLSAPFANFSGAESITSGFVAGINTLDFIVNNTGGPTGLRVEISGTANAGTSVPEPASLLLVALSMGALGLSRRNRKV
jgi:hypothetical protein